MMRQGIVVLSFTALLTGCPSVHTMRGAEVLEVGKSEVTTHVGTNGFVVAASTTSGGQTESDAGVGMIP